MNRNGEDFVCMTLRLPRKLADQVIARAEKNRRSRNEWISLYMEKKLLEDSGKSISEE